MSNPHTHQHIAGRHDRRPNIGTDTPRESEEGAPYDAGMSDMDEEERDLREHLSAVQAQLAAVPNRTEAVKAKQAVVSDALGCDDPAQALRAIAESGRGPELRREAACRLVDALGL